MTEEAKVNKKALVYAVLEQHIQINDDGTKVFDLERKDLIPLCYDALIAGGVDKLDVKEHLITSYIQMGRMKMLQDRSEYTHHKVKAKVKETTDGTAETVENTIPEGAKWSATKADVTEYFKTRKAAREMSEANGADWEVAKLA